MLLDAETHTTDTSPAHLAPFANYQRTIDLPDDALSDACDDADETVLRDVLQHAAGLIHPECKTRMREDFMVVAHLIALIAERGTTHSEVYVAVTKGDRRWRTSNVSLTWARQVSDSASLPMTGLRTDCMTLHESVEIVFEIPVDYAHALQLWREFCLERQYRHGMSEQGVSEHGVREHPEFIFTIPLHDVELAHHRQA